MTIVRQERIALFAEAINANGKTARSPHFSCEFADYAIILLDVDEIGSPGGSDYLYVYVVHVDSDGNEYIDANTTYGTVSIVGTDTPVNKSFVVPYLGDNIAVKAVGGSTLSSTTGYTVSARIVLVGNTDFPDMYK